MRLFWTNTILNTFKHRLISTLDILNRKMATSDPVPMFPSLYQAMKGPQQLFGNTF